MDEWLHLILNFYSPPSDTWDTVICRECGVTIHSAPIADDQQEILDKAKAHVCK